MCEIVINGGRRLSGEIHVQGSKNAVLPILAACVMTNDECVVHNCPQISDVASAAEILTSLGGRAEFDENTARICAEKVNCTFVSKDLMQKMRSSVMFMGAMLARCGEVMLYRPGGCRLGERPIDMHINSFVRLGAEIYEQDECIFCRLNKIKSGDITLLYPSVGVTENIMLLCAGKNCDVKIYNPAKEPEITELQNFLNLMGADIRGAGSDVIRVCKSDGLHGCEYTVGCDRIAAATYACMTAACGGEIFLRGAAAEHIRLPLAVLEEAGCVVLGDAGGINIKKDKRLSAIHKLKTLPYPGFPTDVQPMLTAALTLADGESQIDETVFENRFSYVPELIKMGADIKKTDCSAVIRGRSALHGAFVAAKDLRGGAALLAAGLAAEGTTVVRGIEYIDRGYEKIEDVLYRAGADIKRLS